MYFISITGFLFRYDFTFLSLKNRWRQWNTYKFLTKFLSKILSNDPNIFKLSYIVFSINCIYLHCFVTFRNQLLVTFSLTEEYEKSNKLSWNCKHLQPRERLPHQVDIMQSADIFCFSTINCKSALGNCPFLTVFSVKLVLWWKTKLKTYRVMMIRFKLLVQQQVEGCLDKRTQPLYSFILEACSFNLFVIHWTPDCFFKKVLFYILPQPSVNLFLKQFYKNILDTWDISSTRHVKTIVWSVTVHRLQIHIGCFIRNLTLVSIHSGRQ